MTPRRASDQAPRAWPGRGDALTSAEWVADTWALNQRPEYRAELPQRWTRPTRQVIPGPWRGPARPWRPDARAKVALVAFVVGYGALVLWALLHLFTP